MIVFFKSFFIIVCLVCVMGGLITGFKINNDFVWLVDYFRGYEKVCVVSKEDFCKSSKVKNGNLNYYTYLQNEKGSLKKCLEDFDSEGIVFYFPLEKGDKYFKQKLNYTFTDAKIISGRKVYSGFLRGFDKFVMIDAKKINVQIAKTDEFWVVGLPLILTGF